MKPAILWVVVAPKASGLNSALGMYSEDGGYNYQPAGTFFIAAYFRKRSAAAMAAKWHGSRVVKVKLEEVQR